MNSISGKLIQLSSRWFDDSILLPVNLHLTSRPLVFVADGKIYLGHYHCNGYFYRHDAYTQPLTAALAGLKLIQDKFEGDWDVDFQSVEGGNYTFPLSDLKVSKEFLDFINKESEKCFE